jgi:hypothetical protein
MQNMVIFNCLRKHESGGFSANGLTFLQLKIYRRKAFVKKSDDLCFLKQNARHRRIYEGFFVFGDTFMPRNRKTWIYLMKDEINGCYKIGRAQNPEYREKTLQSEKPFIVLVEAWEGLESDETVLHKTYAEKRIRGEWFRLTESDVFDVGCYFAEAKKFSTGRSASDERDERELNTYDLADKADWLDFAFEGFGYEI